MDEIQGRQNRNLTRKNARVYDLEYHLRPWLGLELEIDGIVRFGRFRSSSWNPGYVGQIRDPASKNLVKASETPKKRVFFVAVTWNGLFLSQLNQLIIS